MIINSKQRRRQSLYNTCIFYIFITDLSTTVTLALPNRRTASASTSPSPIWNDSLNSSNKNEGNDNSDEYEYDYDYRYRSRSRSRSNLSLDKQLIEEGDRDTFDDLFFGGGAGVGAGAIHDGTTFDESNSNRNRNSNQLNNENRQRQRQRQGNGAGSTILENVKYNQRPSQSSSSSSSSIRNTVANSIIHDSARTISQVLRGDVAGHVPADIFGQTIKEEIVECNRLFDTTDSSSSSFSEGNEFVELGLGNSNNNMDMNNNNIPQSVTFQNKLYGGAQYHRLLQSYHTLFLTQPIQMNNQYNTIHDEIQLLLHGISDNKHDGVDILRAVAILSSHKMSALSQDILNSLARRVEFVLGRRMWYVVEYTLIVRTLGLGLRYGIGIGSEDRHGYGQRVFYGSGADVGAGASAGASAGFGDNGRDVGRLYNGAIFGQGRHVRGGGESTNSVGVDPDGQRLAESSGGNSHHNRNRNRRYTTSLEDLEELDQFEKDIILFVKEKYIKFVKEKVSLAYRLASSDIYALMKFVSWDLAFSNGRIGGGVMGAGTSSSSSSSLSPSSLGQEDWEEEYFEDYDDYDDVENEEDNGDMVGGVLDRGKYAPILPQQDTTIDSETDQLLKHIVQAAVQENVPYGTSMSTSTSQSPYTKTSSAVSALVQHVTNRWRIEISRIVSTKFNSFCLVAFHDEFASFLRREMNEYLKERGD